MCVGIGRLRCRRGGEQTESSGQVDDDGERLSDLRQRLRPNVAERADHTRWRDGTHMLTLRSRRLLEPVGWVRLDDDFGVKASKCARQRNDLDHGR